MPLHVVQTEQSIMLLLMIMRDWFENIPPFIDPEMCHQYLIVFDAVSGLLSAISARFRMAFPAEKKL